MICFPGTNLFSLNLMQPTLHTAVNAARKAGNIVSRNLARVDSLSRHAKQRNDFVTEIDLQAEREIIGMIRRVYPDHRILAEESGSDTVRDEASEYQWIIDPLDGTTNYLHGFPHYSVSIALRYRNTLETGVIYDPFRGELFCASRGHGATLNDRKIRVARLPALEGSLLGTGFPFRENQDTGTYLATLEAFMLRTSGIRRAGSAALDLAYVAAGRLDGFWEFGLNIWDIAAGCLIIQEAGGLVGDTAGGHTHLDSGDIVAANAKLFRQMLNTIHQAVKDR